MEPFVVAPPGVVAGAEPTSPRSLRAKAVVAAVAVAALALVGGTLAGAARVVTRADAPSSAAPASADAGAVPADTGRTPQETAAAITAVADPATGPAYRVASVDGGVFNHGWFGFSGSAAGATTSPIVGL